MRRDDIKELAATIRRWLDLIGNGEMEATPGMIQHLAGAETALRAVLGEPFSFPPLQ
jgi:hypothetical protein